VQAHESCQKQGGFAHPVMSAFALRFEGGSTMRRLVAAALVVACTGLMGPARVDDDDPTGTWRWTTPKGVGTLKLKLEGEKVTGVMVRKAGDLKVEDGIFKDGAISFRVPGKTPGGKRMVHMYQGKLIGDTLKGSATIVLPDQVVAGDWEAKLVKN
jgi:hypothetical protein